MKKKVIDITNLSVQIGATRILDKVAIQVNQGEIVALVGISGSGKTTTIRYLTGQLQSDTAMGSILGYDVKTKWKQVRRSRAKSYVPQLDAKNMYMELSAMDNIRLFGAMYDTKYFMSKKGKQEIHELLDILDVAKDSRDIPTKKLSGGERKRVSLAIAIINHPLLLFLDEPTTGLDEYLKIVIFNYLKRINRFLGITIVMVSHNLEICQYVDQIIVLENGRVVEAGNPREIVRTKLPSYGFSTAITFEWIEDLEDRLTLLSDTFLDVKGNKVIYTYLHIGRGCYKFFCYDMPDKLPEFIHAIYQLGLAPIEITHDDATLLDYFQTSEVTKER